MEGNRNTNPKFKEHIHNTYIGEWWPFNILHRTMRKKRLGRDSNLNLQLAVLTLYVGQ